MAGKETIPTAITGAFLAGLTVLMSISGIVPKPYAIMFPPWAVFITWAGYFAAGGGGKGQAMPTFKKMYVAILWGDIWGFAGGYGIAKIIGPANLSLPLTLLLDGIVIFLVNQPILWGTRYWGPIKYTPAIFYGFAIFFSTYFGGFGFIPGNIYAAFITAYLASCLGPIFGYLQVRFAMIKEVPERKEVIA
ncbi:MAG: DUF1097 family protein [Thermoplasmatales archaeon]